MKLAMAFLMSQLLLPIKRHPFIACSAILLFTPPFFSIVVYFFPLLISTALCLLAVFSFSSQLGASSRTEHANTMDDIPRQPECAEYAQRGRATVVSPSQDGLMVGDQEVTLLEWLHHEHMQKLRAQKMRCVVWDIDDGPDLCASDETTVNAFSMTIRDEVKSNDAFDASDDVFDVKDKNICKTDVFCTDEDECRNEITSIKAGVSDFAHDSYEYLRIAGGTVTDRDGDKMTMDLLGLTIDDEDKITLSLSGKDEDMTTAGLPMKVQNAVNVSVFMNKEEDISEANALLLRLKNQNTVNVTQGGEDEKIVNVVGSTPENKNMMHVHTSIDDYADETITIWPQDNANSNIRASIDGGQDESNMRMATGGNQHGGLLPFDIVSVKREKDVFEVVNSEKGQEENVWKQSDVHDVWKDGNMNGEDEKEESCLRFSFFHNNPSPS